MLCACGVAPCPSPIVCAGRTHRLEHMPGRDVDALEFTGGDA